MEASQSSSHQEEEGESDVEGRKRTGGDSQDGVAAFRGWTVDEGATEPSSQAGRDGLRGSGPDRQWGSLISANQG